MDARIARTHQAVMKAATDLLLEDGPNGLTVDAVVARSGVAKSTVYRHWATRDELVADVFNHCAPILDQVDPALPFDQAIRRLAMTFVEIMDDEHWRRLIPAMVMLKSQKDAIEHLNTEMHDQQSEVISSVLRRGVDEGVLRPSVLEDLDTTMTLLVGPILMAALVETVPLDAALADMVVAQFLAGQQAVDSPALLTH
ncbi:TetR/AcrR family transcriptional regulator [soil metagenome]